MLAASVQPAAPAHAAALMFAIFVGVPMPVALAIPAARHPDLSSRTSLELAVLSMAFYSCEVSL